MKTRTQLTSGSACYTVRSGDTLSGIAKRYYGTPNAYPKIYYSNQQAIGPNENVLRQGLKLYLPD